MPCSPRRASTKVDPGSATIPSAQGFDVLRAVAAAGATEPKSALRERRRRQALDLARGEGLVQAAYSYRIVPLDRAGAEVLQAEGETLHAPWLLPESGQLTGIACAVCTIGPGLEARVSGLFSEKRASLALALNDLGNELVFAVSRRAQDRILVDARRRNLSVSGELRPGDPGLELEAQSAVMRLAQAEKVEVSLNRGRLMRPLMSTSMVLGVGIDLPPATWSRCDQCPFRTKCRVVDRSQSAAAASSLSAQVEPSL